METTFTKKLAKDFVVYYKGIILIAAPFLFLPAALIGQNTVSMSYNRQVKLHTLFKYTHLLHAMNQFMMRIMALETIFNFRMCVRQ